jgi:hypothetical protein
MNVKLINDVVKEITKTKTKFFIKGKIKGEVFYIGLGGSVCSHPYYFDFESFAKESKDNFIYKYSGFAEFGYLNPSQMEKKIKIFSRTETESKWERLGSLNRKRLF